MKHSAKNLIGFTLSATDGEIGKVKDFYFDDETWTIRYLVVSTGTWLSNRVVLISPEALSTPNGEHKFFPVDLTREQIKNSPNINTDIPVSRQEEIRLHNYYPWITYWAPGYLGGAGPIADSVKQSEQRKQEEREGKHLRSMDKVTAYSINAIDGNIGNVEDFLVDDTWKIDFMLIDIGHWFSEKKVLLSPKLIKEISWETASVSVNTTIVQVKDSPKYDPNQELTEVYTLALQDKSLVNL